MPPPPPPSPDVSVFLVFLTHFLPGHLFSLINGEEMHEQRRHCWLVLRLLPVVAVINEWLQSVSVLFTNVLLQCGVGNGKKKAW